MTDRATLMQQVKRKRLMEQVAAKRASEEQGGPEPLKTDAGSAALRGAAQGASLGFIDELTAGVGAAKDWGAGKLGLRGDIDFDDAYGTYIDKIRGADKKAAAEQPTAYIGGALAGGIGSAVVGPLGALNSASTATKAGGALAGAGAKVAPGLAAGAVRTIGKEGLGRIGLAGAQGAVTGAGTSEANPFASPDELGEFAGDVMKGGALGAGTAGLVNNVVAPAVSKAAKDVPAWLKNVAERRAFKAGAGTQSKAYNEAVRQGTVNKTGRDMLDEGVVTFGASPRQIAEKAETGRMAVGDKMDELFSSIDDTAGATVSGPDIGKALRDFAVTKDAPGNDAFVQKVLGYADDFENRGQLSLSEAQRLKNLYKWDPRDPLAMPLGKEGANKMKMILGDEMERGVERGAQLGKSEAGEQFSELVQTGSGQARTQALPNSAVTKEATAVTDDKLAEYLGLKGKYGSMATAKRNATELANRLEKNRTFSLTDYIAGGALGGATMNPLAAGAGALANKVMRERGNSAIAVTLDKASKMLENSPQTLGPYAEILRKAASRGSLGVVHSMLMKEPDYAARMAAP